MQKNQKGFLIALCLCMLSISGIFGVYQYQKGKNANPETTTPKQSAQVEETQKPEKEAANSEGTVAELGTEEKEQEKEKEEKKEAKVETEEDVKEIGEAELAVTEQESEEVPEETVEDEETNETTAETEMDDLENIAFADDGKLAWPVEGNVIMNYSMDKSIYFSTLNQYKYHPAIVISANVGTEVLCAARGKVSKITVNEETGTTLTMELGSGYKAIYGQLKEVAVEEGEMVELGERIGYVSEPTKYYSLEGSNLYFQLLKDGEPVNPMDYLE